jgi:outer membrane receptor for ferrienterochelin and colicins
MLVKLITTAPLSFISLLLIALSSFATEPGPNTEIKGTVTSEGKELPFVNILLKGTHIGASSNLDGQYQIQNIPVGKYIIRAQGIGLKTRDIEVDVTSNSETIVNFDMQADLLNLDQIVVTASKFETDRRDAPIVVNVLSPKLFDDVHAVSLADGLNFTPGLRVENNCQNCGFTQLRMNGLEGPYSQLLINSRPVFSSLTGVYALEQIPANMIERIEVVRGGGSALYGSNAVAGTVNVITREPMSNTFSLGSTLSLINAESPELISNFNTSLVTTDYQSGISIYGSLKDRQPWDANNDSFSEITKLKVQNAGFRAYHKLNKRNKISIDLNAINDFRRGGNDFDLLPHQSNITEQAEHRIVHSGITYELFSADYKNKLSVFSAVQYTDRDSYYGADQDPNAYGSTTELNTITGLQLTSHLERLLFAPAVFTAGAELLTNDLNDDKISVSQEQRINISNQSVRNAGIFLQNQWNIAPFQVSAGLRYDHHNLLNKAVLSPRVNLLYSFGKGFQARVGYATGFRPPQIFDEDLHIEVSGAQAVRQYNDPGLKHEGSQSITASLDHSGVWKGIHTYLLLEGFHTKLKDAFVNELVIDDQGVFSLYRSNGPGARVSGVNLETQFAFSRKLNLQMGFTVQQSLYNEEAVIWEPESGNADSTASTRQILKTPGGYGYMVLAYTGSRGFNVNLSGIYTGSMHMAHMLDAETAYTVIKNTPQFFDLGVKFSKDFKLSSEIRLQVNAGVQNIFNSYQGDFDTGVERDGGYIYGPSRPRTIFFGISLGSVGF